MSIWVILYSVISVALLLIGYNTNIWEECFSDGDWDKDAAALVVGLFWPIFLIMLAFACLIIIFNEVIKFVFTAPIDLVKFLYRKCKDL